MYVLYVHDNILKKNVLVVIIKLASCCLDFFKWRVTVREELRFLKSYSLHKYV